MGTLSMLTTAARGHVRTFVARDIPHVARLHRTVFDTAARAGASWLDMYSAYLTRVFLENPTRHPALPSLVHEDEDGSIAGFLGVVSRPMTMNGRRFQAAISSQFVVAPCGHAGLIALRLARAFLEGPQDLAISDEANDTSRRIWEGLGGSTSLLHSLYWTRPLRPARLAVAMLRRRVRLAPLAVTAAPFAPFLDAIAMRVARRELGGASPDVSSAEELTERTVLACLPRCTRPGTLRVEYDERTLAWSFEHAKRRAGSGAFHAASVRKGERVVGWYLYCVDAEHVAQVVQIAAEPLRVHDVLDQLFAQAARDGANAVSGRVDPSQLQALTDRHCLLHRRGPWVLVSTKHPDLLRSFQTGEACFSRLDGEWCLGF
ncbi:MAG TPA: hypothetical protein VK886_01520 [Vicinamibacterales bacterium]|nr:hypothetical protein [Vicinamibacterales bacterium]